MGIPTLVQLAPKCPTPLPGTTCELWWDGDETVVLYQRDGIWDLSPLVQHPGSVLAWERVAGRPHLGWWPIVPLSSRGTYRSYAGTA